MIVENSNYLARLLQRPRSWLICWTTENEPVFEKIPIFFFSEERAQDQEDVKEWEIAPEGFSN